LAKSDCKSLGHPNPDPFMCYDILSGIGEHKAAVEYENDFGFVPHNYACYSKGFKFVGQVCSSTTHHLTSDKIRSKDPAQGCKRDGILRDGRDQDSKKNFFAGRGGTGKKWDKTGSTGQGQQNIFCAGRDMDAN